MQWSKDWGTLVSSGTATPHQLLGIIGRGICPEEFHKKSDSVACSPENGQYNSDCIYKQTWGDPLSRTIKPCCSFVELGTQQGHDFKCRTSTRHMEHAGRSEIKVLPRFQRLENRPNHFSGSNENSGALPDRLVCESPKHSTPNIFHLETRSPKPSFRCFSPELGPGEKLRLPTILPNNENISQDSGGRRRTCFDHSSLANTGLVPCTAGDVGGSTNPPSSISQLPQQSSGGATPSISKQNSVPGRMACIKQSISTEGISDKAAELILASWRPGTNSIYNSAWLKWDSWCSEREINSLFPSLANIIDFLSHSFDLGLQYRTINTYRSALSSVISPIEGFPIGQHPLAVRLMKGIQNKRPAMPRYQHCWDINKVLEYIKTLLDNHDLPLKTLTGKLATLMAITAPKRSSELKLLDLRFYQKRPEGVVFNPPGLTKTSSEVRSVFFANFPTDKSLCVTTTLEVYPPKTSLPRATCPFPSQASSFFLTTGLTNLYNPVL